ncbi:MAG: TIR domain-containing protein [Parvularculaceae bacterium]
MGSIFISYAHPDVEIVRKLQTEFGKLGHDVISSSDDLDGLSKNSPELKLITQADVYIPIFSPRSERSMSLLLETGIAAAAAKRREDFWVFPVELDNATLPLDLQKYPIHAVRDDADLVHFVQTVNSRIIFSESSKRYQEYTRDIKKVEREERSVALEKNVHEFVEEALSFLDAREKRANTSSEVWFKIGFSALVASALALGGSLAYYLRVDQSDPWVAIVITLKTLFIISLLIATSRYAFILGKHYSIDAQKSADRIHAISFGKFYLRVYGADAGWNEMKEVFRDWNIGHADGDKHISPEDFDPRVLDKLVAFAKIVRGKA